MDKSSVAGEEILTTEVFDFIRLSYLLDFAKLPLLSLLETEGEPLRSLLARKQNIIDRLEKTRKIYEDESLILKQIRADTGSTDLDKLDIRLLCVLVRNISNVRMPKNGWIKKKLAADDTSEGADVLRIGDIRNNCHHLPSSARITKEKFDDIYPKLQQVSYVFCLAVCTYQSLTRWHKHWVKCTTPSGFCLLVCRFFFVPLENFALIWRRHLYR